MKSRKIHIVQHVPFEGPGSIGSWAKDRGWELSITRLYENSPLPDPSIMDLIVVLGGPMSVHDVVQYPWLTAEKAFVRKALEADRKVLGICLGAQLLAESFGAKVYQNRYTEIGWYPVNLSIQASESWPGRIFPQRFQTFHWHGETFDLPPGTTHLMSSEGCFNQAFAGQNCLGLQFHLEMTTEGAKDLIKHSDHRNAELPYVQAPDAILEPKENFNQINQWMNACLDEFTQSVSAR